MFQKLRLVRWAVIAVLLTIAVVSLNGVLGNIWAASFGDSNREIYIRHANLCLLSLIASSSGFIVALFWGNWQRLGRWLSRGWRSNATR